MVVTDGGNYDWTDVQGESHKMEQIERVLADAQSQGLPGADRRRMYFENRATVRPEPANVVDSRAIVVEVDGQSVGYISSSDTESFRQAVHIEAVRQGLRVVGDAWTVRTGASIKWAADHTRYSVALDLPSSMNVASALPTVSAVVPSVDNSELERALVTAFHAGIDASIAIPSSKNRAVALVLCILLGVFGAHRFYVNKPGTAVAQLLTLGGLGIWTLVDFILILTGTFTDERGRRLTTW